VNRKVVRFQLFGSESRTVGGSQVANCFTLTQNWDLDSIKLALGKLNPELDFLRSPRAQRFDRSAAVSDRSLNNAESGKHVRKRRSWYRRSLFLQRTWVLATIGTLILLIVLFVYLFINSGVTPTPH